MKLYFFNNIAGCGADEYANTGGLADDIAMGFESACNVHDVCYNGKFYRVHSTGILLHHTSFHVVNIEGVRGSTPSLLTRCAPPIGGIWDCTTTKDQCDDNFASHMTAACLAQYPTDSADSIIIWFVCYIIIQYPVKRKHIWHSSACFLQFEFCKFLLQPSTFSCRHGVGK